MNNDHLEFPEPERYELQEGPYYHFTLKRREFIQVLGAGLLISITTPGLAQRGRGGQTPSPAERLHLGADGTITVLTGKVEVGQGSRTQITQAAAEELGVAMQQIKLIMADSQIVPDDGGTAGSRTTPSTVPAVRKACAAARQMLLATAAERFHTQADTLSVEDGQIKGLAKEVKFGYADLVVDKEASPLSKELPRDVRVKPVDQWRVLGQPVPRVIAREIVTGKHQYPSDIVRPGMIYGVALRAPAYNSELLDIDLAPAQALPEVTAVRDGDFVGFTAPTSRAAAEARDAAAKTAKWKTGEQASSDQLFDHLRNRVSQGRSRRSREGDVNAALKDAAKILRQTYTVAYIQHAPMEPRTAVAEWRDGQLTVWTGTQQPPRVRSDLARSFRIPVERVRLIVPDTGGGFGGKHTGEAALEAARLALAAGKPVHVRWSREEEFTWAYFRPAGVIDMTGALNEAGALLAWEQINFNSGGSAIATPYDVPNSATEFKSCDQPLRSGSYRALASTANTFARESFMDELAAENNTDPLEFRLRHLTNDRLKAVLLTSAERFDWKKQRREHSAPQATGVGLACGIEKGSYVATCARVRVNPANGTYNVQSVCQAYECGKIINPKNLQAQVEGAIIQGLGAVMAEEMRFAEGKMLNPRFSQYRVPRLRDVPSIETVLIDRPDLPSVGGSETPIIGIAPAVANALYNAVQTRVRALPLRNATYRAA